MKLPKNLGTFLLGIYLVLQGLVSVFHLSFIFIGLIMGLLALLSGLALLLGR
jgi:hypothetical protein